MKGEMGMKQQETAFVLRARQVEAALDKNYRQYLTGRLERPQKELDCLEDDIEVGMSRYDCFTADVPHRHPMATEHVYVLEGEVRVRLLESGQEYRLERGDFFLLRPGVAYASKNAAGTRVLFVKAPGGNDKQPVEPDPDTAAWLERWD